MLHGPFAPIRCLLPATQGRYAEAEPLYQRSLGIGKKALGPEHPAVASSLNDLAALLDLQVMTSVLRKYVSEMVEGSMRGHFDFFS